MIDTQSNTKIAECRSAPCPGASRFPEVRTRTRCAVWSRVIARSRHRWRVCVCMQRCSGGQSGRGLRAAVGAGRRHDATARARHAAARRSGQRADLRQSACSRERGHSTLTQFLDLNANSVSAASGQGNPFQQSLEFPRLCRLAAARHAAGHVRVPGRRAHQRGVRRCRQLGPAPAVGDFERAADTRVGAGVRPQHAGRRARDLHEERRAISRWRRSKLPAARSAGARSNSSTAALPSTSMRSRPGNFSDDNGWALHNASRVRQFFGKVGWQDDRSDLDVSITLADNALQGAQTLPLSFLDRPRESYTYPDLNENRLAFVAAKGSRFVGDSQLIDANVYYRRFRNANLSSNVNDDYGVADPDTGAVQANPATNDRATIDQTLVRRRRAMDGAHGRSRATRTNRRSVPAANCGDDAFRAGIAARDIHPRSRRRSVPATSVDTTIVALRKFRRRRLRDRHVVAVSRVDADAASARYDTSRVVIADRSGRDRALNGSARVLAPQSRARRQLQSDSGVDRVCELQRRHARADADRADLRRPDRAVQAAERVPRRPVAREGRLVDDRDRHSRQVARNDVVGCHLSDRSSRRSRSSSRAERVRPTPAISRTSAARGARGSSSVERYVWHR